MVRSHLQASQSVASGLHSMPDVHSAFAATQAAYRFLNNERVTLRALAAPLIEAGRQAVAVSCDRYVLAAHDWSLLNYSKHTAKKDRAILSSNRVPEGYELQTALLVSDRDGAPLAPVAMSLRAADGVHCSRSWQVRPPLSPLDELDPTMTYLEKQSLGRPLVHLIDAEADSVFHFRQWSQCPGRNYLVRADDRIVEQDGTEKRCSVIRETLRQQGAFRPVREVEIRGQKGMQWVAEVAVRLLRPAQRNRPKRGARQRIPGPPLPLRLLLAEVRDETGKVLAIWYLLTNLPEEVDTATIALWYYWRWRIEKYFKLMKSAGMNAEQWQQDTAGAIARRLLIASMACVMVWQLARSQHPHAQRARNLLIRLSGRQMKWKQPFTMPALLAGTWVLLAMIDALESYTIEELRQYAEIVMPRAP